MERDWNREKDKVWRQAQKAVGIPVTKQLREAIEDRAGPVRDDTELEDYKATIYSDLELVRMGLVRGKFPEPRKPKKPPKKRYPRSVRRRLYLVQFVINQQLTSTKRRGRIRRRIKWKEICGAWNEAHPNDPATPEYLRRTFGRAVRDEDVQQEYFRQIGIGIGEALAWDRLVGLVGSARLALDWAILLGAHDIPLDRGFPSPEMEGIIRNNPDYARQAVNEWLAVETMRVIVKRHLRAAQDMYEPVTFEEGGTK